MVAYDSFIGEYKFLHVQFAAVNLRPTSVKALQITRKLCL